MATLNDAERELVALGAALASNCIPCIHYHVPQARKAGLTDPQIHEAILLADKVRQVPARKVLAAATGLTTPDPAATGVRPGESGCGRDRPEGEGEAPCCE